MTWAEGSRLTNWATQAPSSSLDWKFVAKNLGVS